MKIDNSIKPLTQRPGATAGRAASAAAKDPKVAGLQVELSASGLESSRGSSQAFDAGRVAEIRQAIAEGRFSINPERIADGLVDSVREMLSQRRQVA